MEDIRNIPQIRAYLLDIEIFDQFKKVAEKHGIDEKRVDEFLDLTDAVTKGELEIAQMPALAKQAFGVDDEKATALCADIAGYRLLPLEQYIDGVKEAIESWGGSISDYPEKRIKKQVRDIDKRIHEMAQELELELPDHLMKRFMFIVRGYVTGERDKDATVTLMKRPLNIGGLQMTDAQATNMLTLVDKEKSELLPEKKEEDTVSEPPPASPSKGGESGADLLLSKEGQGEVPKEDMPKKEVAEVPTQKTEITPGEKVSREELMKRLQSAENGYLEELRSKPAVPPPPPPPPPAQPDKTPKAESKEMEFDDEVPPEIPPMPEDEKKKVLQAGEHSDSEQLPAVKPPADVSDPSALEPKKKRRRRRRRRRKKKTDTVPEEQTSEDQKEEKAAALVQEEKNEAPKKVAEEKPQQAKKVEVKTGPKQESKPEPAPKKQEKSVPAKPSAPPSSSPKSKEQAVNDALAPVVEIFKQKRIARKTFMSLATAHVKGLKDPLKTYETLKQDHKLEGAELDQAFKALESARKIVQGDHAAMQKKLAKQDIFEDTKDLEKEVMDKRHAAMTKSVADDSVEPVLPSGQVSAARTKKEELEVQKSKIDEEKVKKAQESSKPKKAKAKLSMKSAPPTEGAKKVQDVKFVQKLVGPVEELGMMGPAEFRRLSSDPKEAAQKVEDKLDLIEQTSYDMRIKGVAAWRKSPVCKLYLQMTNEALMQGVSVSEIASKRRNAGEESLSPGEIQSIVALNKRITF